MLPPDYQQSLLALVAWREAAGEGEAGMLAVMCVIRNRVTHGWEHGSYPGVICKHAQFSSMTIKGDAQTVNWPADDSGPSATAFLLAWELAGKVLHGGALIGDTTHGALYYANLATMDAGGWYEREIIGRPDVHHQTAQIGKHTFHA